MQPRVTGMVIGCPKRFMALIGYIDNGRVRIEGIPADSVTEATEIMDHLLDSLPGVNGNRTETIGDQPLDPAIVEAFFRSPS